MKVLELQNDILVVQTDFSAKKTFECGQCFRFEQTGFNAENAEETFTGVAFGKVLQLRQNGNSLVLRTNRADFENIWRGFLDLNRDYNSLSSAFYVNDFMKKAVEFSDGLSILAQEPWETLISFILSQCNNIPRIKNNIESLCRLFGNPIDFEGKTYYSFPDFYRVANLSVEDLAPVRCGYRAEYIIKTAYFLAENPLFFEELRSLPTAEARKRITTLRGVGEKVANCFLLFGAGKLDAFPVDTWMKKAESRWFGGKFDPAVFGEYAGIAQQYIFYYMRNGSSEYL